jgi:hypothetical protein
VRSFSARRERRQQEFSRSPALRDRFPSLGEVRIELTFADETALPPSMQSYCYFPAARAFFRYACPCHACSGEFDVGSIVAAAADGSARGPRDLSETLSCAGVRAHGTESVPCPIKVAVRVHAIPQQAAAAAATAPRKR